VMGRRSEYAAYSEELITYSGMSTFDQRAGAAFSQLWSLETRILNRARRSLT